MMPLGAEDFGSGGDGEDPQSQMFDSANNGSGFFSSTRSSPRSQASAMGGPFDPNSERFSRKVFVGGLPPDIDEGTPNGLLKAALQTEGTASNPSGPTRRFQMK